VNVLFITSLWMKNESYGVTTISNESSSAALSHEQVALTTSPFLLGSSTLLTCASWQLAWASTPSDRLDATYKRLHHTAAIRNWEGGCGTRAFKNDLETNHHQLSVICTLCNHHQGCHYGSCAVVFAIFSKSLNFFHNNWIPNIMVNFCYLTL